MFQLINPHIVNIWQLKLSAVNIGII